MSEDGHTENLIDFMAKRTVREIWFDMLVGMKAWTLHTTDVFNMGRVGDPHLKQLTKQVMLEYEDVVDTWRKE